jgi:hypothetical protein
VLLDFAFPYLVSAESEKRVFVLPADGHTSHAATIRHGENDLSGAVVGADLHAALRGDKLAAFERVADAFSARVVFPIGDVEVEEALFVRSACHRH